eukprot:SAG31_NODE_7541_length_1659_cov_3.112821_1_plen_453_part_00
MYFDTDGVDAYRSMEPRAKVSATALQGLRQLHNGHAIRVAHSDGRLYTDEDLTTARRVIKADFDKLNERLQKERYTAVVLPANVASWLADGDNERLTKGVTHMLHHRCHRLYRHSQRNKVERTTELNASGICAAKKARRPYSRDVDGTLTPTARLMEHIREYRQARRKQPLCMRRLRPLMDSLKPTADDGQSRHTESRRTNYDQRHHWLRRASPDDSSQSSVRKQSPTILAPVHPGGLTQYQAGPICEVQVNGTKTNVMFDSGFTSDMNSPWVLVTPEFCVLHDLQINPKSRNRVALADGETVRETLGTVPLSLQLPNGMTKVDARVLDMSDPDQIDVLVGFSFMMNLNASLYMNTRPEQYGPDRYGVEFPGNNLLPYTTAWTPEQSALQLSRTRTREDASEVRAGGGDEQARHTEKITPKAFWEQKASHRKITARRQQSNEAMIKANEEQE